MNKELYIIFVGDLEKLPPLITLIKVLDKNGYNLTVLTSSSGIEKNSYNGQTFKNVKFKSVVREYNDGNLLYKIIRLFSIRRKLWKELNLVPNAKLLIVSEITIKHLGKRLLKRNYFYYQLELIREAYFIPRFNFFKVKLKKYAQKAVDVIVPEYNRAHIMKTWWGLKKLPIILPNKPIIEDDIKLPQEICNLVTSIKNFSQGRKIIIYQGIISKERPIDVFIKAIEKRSDEYCFIIMGNKKPDFPIDDNFCYFVPFIKPPYHLAITEIAYIGVLVYVSTKDTAYSELNAVYCAPNKIWEYSKFGIPMVANDLPSLKPIFEEKNIGICIDDINEDNILKAFDKVVLNYDNMHSNSLKFYDTCDMECSINKIFSKD